MPPLSKAMLDIIIKGLGPKKAPDIDKLNGIVVKNVWLHAKELIIIFG